MQIQSPDSDLINPIAACLRVVHCPSYASQGRSAPLAPGGGTPRGHRTAATALQPPRRSGLRRRPAAAGLSGVSATHWWCQERETIHSRKTILSWISTPRDQSCSVARMTGTISLQVGSPQTHSLCGDPTPADAAAAAPAPPPPSSSQPSSPRLLSSLLALCCPPARRVACGSSSSMQRTPLFLVSAPSSEQWLRRYAWWKEHPLYGRISSSLW
jgi:hypothetical protein